MPSRETSDHKRASRPADDLEEVDLQSETTARRDDMGSDVDDLLDEIDEVLEENAEDFVKSFVQKGGQ